MSLQALWRGAGVLAVLALAIPVRAQRDTNRPATQPPAEAWTISDDAPCTGLTIGWAIPLPELRHLLGAGVEPAAGPAPGTGLLLLFAARCPGATIGGERTGPFVTTHVIVPIAPPSADIGARAPEARGWIAIPTTFDSLDAAVGTLFRRHGFAVRPGRATVEIEPVPHATRGRFVLATSSGRLEAEATFADSARHFESVTGLVGGGADARALAHGPEHSMRQSGGRATVTVKGTTILSGLHPVGAPVAVLDTHFVWSFSFERSDTPRRMRHRLPPLTPRSVR